MVESIEIATHQSAAPREPDKVQEVALDPEALAKQQAAVLQGVASQCSTLLYLLNDACQSTEVSTLLNAMDTVRIVIASIGSLADGFAPIQMRGNQYGWHLDEETLRGIHA